MGTIEIISLIIAGLFASNLAVNSFVGVDDQPKNRRTMRQVIRLSVAIALLLIVNYGFAILGRLLGNAVNVNHLDIIIFAIFSIAITFGLSVLSIRNEGFKQFCKEAFGVDKFPIFLVLTVILGGVLLVFSKDVSLLTSTLMTIGFALGLILVAPVFKAIGDRMERTSIPRALQGLPIMLIIAGLAVVVFLSIQNII